MTSAPPVVRIVVADDHHVVRTGFAALLDTQPDFAVVGTADDGTEAVRICRELSPDVVLMDVRMPVMDGIEATRQLAGSGPDRGPGPRILILTTFDLDSYVYDALCAGASGFLLKDVTAERLFEAVRVIAAGEALLAPAVTRRLISEFTRLRPRPEAPAAGALATLTPRETQVLRLVAEGLSNPEIAARLVVTEETVKTHVSRMLTKLGLRDRTQAVVTAYELGLVVPGSRDPGPSPGLSAQRLLYVQCAQDGLLRNLQTPRRTRHLGCLSRGRPAWRWPRGPGSGAPPALVRSVPAGPLPAGSNPRYR